MSTTGGPAASAMRAPYRRCATRRRATRARAVRGMPAGCTDAGGTPICRGPCPGGRIGVMMVRPRALLFDFGGVLASSTGGAADRMSRLIRRVGELTRRLLTEAEVTADVTAGRRADAQGGDGLARTPDPEELTHLRFWADFVAADWPAPARDAVAAHATELTRIFV